MAKTLKLSILFVALMLPVCIFVFLKLFGTNRFDIPVYYQTEEEIQTTECKDIKTPYVFSFDKLSVFKNTTNNLINSNKVTIFADVSGNDDASYFFARIKERLENNCQVILFGDVVDENMNLDGMIHFKKNDSFQLFWKCDLLNENNTWVLLDNEQRIRGYYEVNEKEIDRLIVEVKILLENQEIESNE